MWYIYTPNARSDSGAKIPKNPGSLRILPVRSPEMIEIPLPTARFEKWSKKVRKTRKLSENQIFDKSHSKNRQMWYIYTPKHMGSAFAISAENMKIMENHDFQLFCHPVPGMPSGIIKPIEKATF